MKEHLDLDFTNMDFTAKIAKALASKVRLKILDTIKYKPLNISEIADRIGIPISSAALHINVLEEAGIVLTQSMPGLRGSQKVCGLKIENVNFTILNQEEILHNKNVLIETMPIGNYSDCDITAPCGIVSDTSFLSAEDSIYGFYSSQKHTAQLIWFTTGYLEYRFSNYRLKNINKIKELEFSFELCSEAPGYNNNWKSDITVSINGLEAGTIISLGDYGGRRGKLNPDWWNDNMTQFGLLRNVLINEFGTYIDGVKVSDLSFMDYKVLENNFISLKIGVKKEAKYVGGLNLFGEKFGDFSQDINMRISY